MMMVKNVNAVKVQVRPSDIPPDDWSPDYKDDDDDDDDDDQGSIDEDDLDPAGGHGLHSHI